MNFSRCIFLLFFTFTSLLAVKAQDSCIVSGTVYDENRRPISDALVMSLLSDRAVSSVTTTAGSGEYTLPVDKKTAWLKASCPGYRDTVMPFDSSRGLKVDFILTDASTSLGEFTFVAKRSSLTTKAGKYIFDPGDLSKYVDTASRIFDYVPLLSKDGDKLEIISKTGQPLILINGEEPSLPQTQILDYLKRISSKKIKKVEIVMNPGATYGDAAQRRGVVNIIMDDDYKGISGTLSTMDMFNNARLKFGESGAVLYGQNHNWLASAGVVYSPSLDKDTRTDIYSDIANGIDRESLFRLRKNNHNFSVWLTGEYRFGRNALAVSVITSPTYEYSSSTGQIDETRYGVRNHTISRSLDSLPWCTSIAGQVRYRRTLEDNGNSNLEIAVSGNHSTPRHYTSTVNTYTVLEGVESGSNYEHSTLTDQSNTVRMSSYGLSAKYRKKFRATSSLNANFGLSGYDGSTRYHNPEDPYNYNNHYGIIQAAVSYSHTWNRILSTNIGIKQSYIRRKITADGEPVLTEYGLFQPNISVALSPGRGHGVNLFWQVMKDAPSDIYLNPHIIWLSSDTYRVGNPRLRPTTAYSWNLQYNFRGLLFFSSEYMQGKTYVSKYLTGDEQGYTVISSRPDQHNRNLRLNLSYNQNFLGYRLSVRPMVWMFWNNSFINTDTEYFSSHNVSYTFSVPVRGVLTRSRDLIAELTYNYSSSLRNLTESYNGGSMFNLSVSKNFSSNISLRANAGFRLKKTETILYSPGIEQSSVLKSSDALGWSINFSWVFGKTSIERVEQISTN